MHKSKQKQGRANNSSPSLSPRLLKALKDIYINAGGTVTYTFIEERTDFSDPKFPNGKEVKIKTNLSCSINPKILYNEYKGKRTPQEVLEIFETTCWDLGASYFVIN